MPASSTPTALRPLDAAPGRGNGKAHVSHVLQEPLRAQAVCAVPGFNHRAELLFLPTLPSSSTLESARFANEKGLVSENYKRIVHSLDD